MGFRNMFVGIIICVLDSNEQINVQNNAKNPSGIESTLQYISTSEK